MTETELNKLKYPVGKFTKPELITDEQRLTWINTIVAFPKLLKEFTNNLSKEQLYFRYRPEGWTIKQVVHHCADSHMNSFIRFKLTLTEDEPVIKPYYEDRWAELIDSVDIDISDSITLITSLHRKWGKLLRTLTNEELLRNFIHPEHGKKISLIENIGIYAWHCDHHLAHIEQALDRKGIFNS